MISFRGSISEYIVSSAPADMFKPANIDAPIHISLSQDSTTLVVSSSVDEFNTLMSVDNQPSAFVIVSSPRALVFIIDYLYSNQIVGLERLMEGFRE